MSEPRDESGEIRRDDASRGEIPRDEPARRESVRVTDDGITEVGFDDPELRPLPPDKLFYHVPHPDPHPESHEHSDVPIRPLVVALAAIALTCAVSFGLLYWLFWRYEGQQRAQEIPRTAVPVAKPTVPEPRLQGVPGFSDNHPTQDMRQMGDRYRAKLTSYGKSEGGAATVPIERAMELALERKLFPVADSAKGAGAAGGTGESAKGKPAGSLAADSGGGASGAGGATGAGASGDAANTGKAPGATGPTGPQSQPHQSEPQDSKPQSQQPRSPERARGQQ